MVILCICKENNQQTTTTIAATIMAQLAIDSRAVAKPQSQLRRCVQRLPREGRWVFRQPPTLAPGISTDRVTVMHSQPVQRQAARDLNLKIIWFIMMAFTFHLLTWLFAFRICMHRVQSEYVWRVYAMPIATDQASAIYRRRCQ